MKDYLKNVPMRIAILFAITSLMSFYVVVTFKKDIAEQKIGDWIVISDDELKYHSLATRGIGGNNNSNYMLYFRMYSNKCSCNKWSIKSPLYDKVKIGTVMSGTLEFKKNKNSINIPIKFIRVENDDRFSSPKNSPYAYDIISPLYSEIHVAMINSTNVYFKYYIDDWMNVVEFETKEYVNAFRYQYDKCSRL